MNTNRRLDLIAMLFGLGAAITGGVGIVGYAFRIPALLQPSSEAAPIVLAAALAVLLGGIATMAAAVPPTTTSRRLSSILGTIVALIGAIAVAEHALRLDLLIDAPALHASIGQGGAFAGRIELPLAVGADHSWRRSCRAAGRAGSSRGDRAHRRRDRLRRPRCDLARRLPSQGRFPAELDGRRAAGAVRGARARAARRRPVQRRAPPRKAVDGRRRRGAQHRAYRRLDAVGDGGRRRHIDVRARPVRVPGCRSRGPRAHAAGAERVPRVRDPRARAAGQSSAQGRRSPHR